MQIRCLWSCACWYSSCCNIWIFNFWLLLALITRNCHTCSSSVLVWRSSIVLLRFPMPWGWLLRPWSLLSILISSNLALRWGSVVTFCISGHKIFMESCMMLQSTFLTIGNYPATLLGYTIFPEMFWGPTACAKFFVVKNLYPFIRISDLLAVAPSMFSSYYITEYAW